MNRSNSQNIEVMEIYMLKQFSKFTLIGISNTLINFLVYNGILWLVRKLHIFPNADYLIAQIISFTLSVFWSFCMSRKFVFNSKEEKAIPWYQALIKMFLSYSFTGIVLNSILSIIWVNVFGISKELLTLINDIIAAPINFILIKFWTFKKG